MQSPVLTALTDVWACVDTHAVVELCAQVTSRTPAPQEMCSGTEKKTVMRQGGHGVRMGVVHPGYGECGVCGVWGMKNYDKVGLKDYHHTPAVPHPCPHPQCQATGQRMQSLRVPGGNEPLWSPAPSSHTAPPGLTHYQPQGM